MESFSIKRKYIADGVFVIYNEYRNNRFSQFDTGVATSGKSEPDELLQLLRLL